MIKPKFVTHGECWAVSLLGSWGGGYLLGRVVSAPVVVKANCSSDPNDNRRDPDTHQIKSTKQDRKKRGHDQEPLISLRENKTGCGNVM